MIQPAVTVTTNFLQDDLLDSSFAIPSTPVNGPVTPKMRWQNAHEGVRGLQTKLVGLVRTAMEADKHKVGVVLVHVHVHSRACLLRLRCFARILALATFCLA